jgi:hypothetical protein
VNLAINSTVHAAYIFQPDEYFSDATGELGAKQTLYTHTYILLPDAASVGRFNPKLSSATFDGEQAHPGENAMTCRSRGRRSRYRARLRSRAGSGRLIAIQY